MSLSRPFGSDGDGLTALGLMTISRALNSRDTLGNTPLHCAAVNARAVHIRALLATKAVEPDVRNHEDLTPLLYLAKEWPGVTPASTVDSLLSSDRVDARAKECGGS